jgi:hypothetical protein
MVSPVSEEGNAEFEGVGLLAADWAHKDDRIWEHSELAHPELAHQISEHRADRRAINAIGRPTKKACENN